MRNYPRTVLFDFGRVISAPKPVSLFESYERDLNLPLGTINRIMFDDPVWEETLLGRRSLEEYWHVIGPRLGLHDVKAVEAFRARYEADERPNEPVISMIRSLHGRVPLAVLSNAPRGLSSWLERWGILHFFDAVFCSAEEGVRKPWKAAYELVLNRLGVCPHHVLFVDDAKENVEAAAALGMVSHLYRDPIELRRFFKNQGLEL
ncbi:MAG: HAD family phosphatase [Desulfosoma sp.]